MELHGASALVAGGASGLGAATVRSLAGAGANVVILDRDSARARAVADPLHATFRLGDVTSLRDVAAAVDEAVSQGPLAVCVACAGVGGGGMVVDPGGRPHDLEEFERIVHVNLVGTFNVIRLAAAAMAQNSPDAEGQRGLIVLTGSIAADEGQAGASAYAASKAAVAGLTLPAARDLAQWGIRVVTIAPGLFRTPLLDAMPSGYRQRLSAEIPFPPRHGDPSEFADLVTAIVGIPYLNGETIRLDAGLRPAAR